MRSADRPWRCALSIGSAPSRYRLLMTTGLGWVVDACETGVILGLLTTHTGLAFRLLAAVVGTPLLELEDELADPAALQILLSRCLGGGRLLGVGLVQLVNQLGHGRGEFLHGGSAFEVKK